MKKIKDFNIIWLVVFLWGVIVLLGWPILMHFFEDYHSFLEKTFYGPSSGGAVTHKIERTPEQQLAGTYVVLTSLITFCSVFLAFIIYNKNKKKEFSSKIHEIQIMSFNTFYRMLEEFDKSIIALRMKSKEKELKGFKVIGEIYDNFRKKELELLKAQDTQGLTKLDNDFLDKTCEINLFEPAYSLFRLLNWIRSQEKYFTIIAESDRDFSNKEKAMLKENITKMRVNLLDILDNYCTAQIEFVFGKYRHLIYHLAEHGKINITRKNYRGFYYADYLLKYEPTLELYNTDNHDIPEEAKQILIIIWNNIQKRYEDEEFFRINDLELWRQIPSNLK